MSTAQRTTRLPRAVVRLLLLLSAGLGVFLIFRMTQGGEIEEGLWDATAFSDRRGGLSPAKGGYGTVKKKIKNWNVPTNQPPVLPPPQVGSLPRPNLSRLNATAPPRTHKGISRVPVLGAPDKYTEGPLPTLDEAWAYLHPRLRAIKEKHQNIPREHKLWNPLFMPFLTDDQKKKYSHLTLDYDTEVGDWVEVERRWLFVTVCRQVAGMLADWFAAWTVLADYLGPESMVFSLIEGDSDDGSGEIFAEVLRDYLLFLGVPPANIFIKTHEPKIDWEAHHRIEKLAAMRNDGMKPLYDSLPEGLTPDGKPWSAIIYYNDVYLSAAHFLELMHHHYAQDADMTCAWDHAGRWFYDGWVGRDMSGDLYTPFPVKDEDRDLPQKLFQNHYPTKLRYDRMLPFQVFSGWNGVVVMSPTPFLPPYNVRFRRGAQAPLGSGLVAADVECQMSESAFISWDFWKYGFGRIQVVPGVHACYGKDDAKVRGWLEYPDPDPEHGYPEQIAWEDAPPASVRCHDWPDLLGKGWWAWDTVRWVMPPIIERPRGT